MVSLTFLLESNPQNFWPLGPILVMGQFQNTNLNPLQHTLTYFNLLQSSLIYHINKTQPTSTYFNPLQPTSTYFNPLQPPSLFYPAQFTYEKNRSKSIRYFRFMMHYAWMRTDYNDQIPSLKSTSESALLCSMWYWSNKMSPWCYICKLFQNWLGIYLALYMSCLIFRCNCTSIGSVCMDMH